MRCGCLIFWPWLFLCYQSFYSFSPCNLQKRPWCSALKGSLDDATGQPVNLLKPEMKSWSWMEINAILLLDGLWRFFISLSSFGCPDGWCSETFAAPWPVLLMLQLLAKFASFATGFLPRGSESRNGSLMRRIESLPVAVEVKTSVCRRSRESAWGLLGGYFSIFSLSCWEPP